jgi:hypothetical protein
MKLLKTISRIVEESRSIYEDACDKGVNEKELERLEKNYRESLKLMNMYNQVKK